MPDLSLKGLDGKLYAGMKISAIEAGVTLREWVVGVLGEAVGRKSALNGRGKKAAVAAGSAVDVVPTPEVPEEFFEVLAAEQERLEAMSGAPSKSCKRCGVPVKVDPKNPKYWKCGSCGRQLGKDEVE